MLSEEQKKRCRDKMEEIATDMYDIGYSDGFGKAKKIYSINGITMVERATKEQIEKWGEELFGWCKCCEKAIEGRWVGLISFCPWCGRPIKWEYETYRD